MISWRISGSWSTDPLVGGTCRVTVTRHGHHINLRSSQILVGFVLFVLHGFKFLGTRCTACYVFCVTTMFDSSLAPYLFCKGSISYFLRILACNMTSTSQEGLAVSAPPVAPVVLLTLVISPVINHRGGKNEIRIMTNETYLW